MKYTTDDVKKFAEQELEEEQLREAIDRYKERIRAGKWWHRFIPFTITIHWRKR